MTVRVVLLEDSEVAVARLRQVLEAAPDIQVVRALGSLAGVALAEELQGSDVVIADMLMPGRSGLGALAEMVALKPVIVVSDAATGSKLASEALARGARAFITKAELATAAGQERLRTQVRRATSRRAFNRLDPIVLFVGSTGAHRALTVIVPAIARRELRIGILQHLPSDGDVAFVQWLAQLGLRVDLATSGSAIAAGTALVAPAGRHMVLETLASVRLRAAAPVDLHVPSADVLLRSAVPFAAAVTCVVLSGLGRDGAEAVGPLVQAGGRVLAQAPDTCAAPSMPRAALAASDRVRAFSPALLAKELVRVSGR